MKPVLDLFLVAACKAARRNERVEGWPAVGRKTEREKRELNRIKEIKAKEKCTQEESQNV